MADDGSDRAPPAFAPELPFARIPPSVAFCGGASWSASPILIALGFPGPVPEVNLPGLAMPVGGLFLCVL
jgi:hypothetical protein